MAYCTLVDVFSAMGYEDAISSVMSVRVEAAIPAAQAAIDNQTGRTFEPVTEARTFSSESLTAWQVLKVPDLVSVTTLKVDDDDDGVFETTIAGTGYELDRSRLTAGWPYDTVRLLDRSFPAGGRRTYRTEITGVWGFAVVPDPVKSACSLLAAQIAQRPSAALYGVQSFGELGGTQGILKSDPTLMLMIGPYKLPEVA